MAPERIRKAYRLLLLLYPRGFRDRFAEPMEQAFADLLNEREPADLADFLLWVFTDTFVDVLHQHLHHLFDVSMTYHRRAAFVALLLALPMGVIVSAIVFEIGWIETAFKSVFTVDGSRPNTYGFAYMFVSLAALPFALAITLKPLFRKGADGRRRFYVINLLIAAAIVALMTPTYGGIAKDIYRCDVLQIPNCD